jgi:stringent starvation protein B
MAFPVPTEGGAAPAPAPAREAQPDKGTARGLRLASTDNDTVNAAAPRDGATAETGDETPEPPSPAPSGGRPSLKRVK